MNRKSGDLDSQIIDMKLSIKRQQADIIRIAKEETDAKRSSLIDIFMKTIGNVNEFSDDAYELALKAVITMYPTLQDYLGIDLARASDQQIKKQTFFSLDGIAVILDHLSEVGLLNSDKKAYAICPTFAAFLAELTEVAKAKDIKRLFIVQQCDPEGLSGRKLNFPHTFPVYVEKTADEFTIAITNSTGLIKINPDTQKPIEIDWLKNLIKVVCKNFPQATVYPLKQGRQNDGTLCHVFTLHDFCNIANGTKQFMKQVKASAQEPPSEWNEEKYTYKYFSAHLPMMQGCQSVQEINRFLKNLSHSDHSLQAIKNESFPFIKEIPIIVKVGNQQKLVMKERNLFIRHLFRKFVRLLAAKATKLK